MVLLLILSSGGLMGRAAFAAAEEPPAKQSVAAQIGLAIPMVGDLKDVADTGFSFGAQVMQEVDAHSRFGVGISYFSFGKESESGVDTEVSVISTLLMTERALAARGRAAPFLKTGIGFARTQVNINASGTPGPAVLQGTNQEDISPTLLVGLGFEWPVSHGAALGVSVDYQHFFFKVGDVNGGGSLTILAQLRM